ncbi:hypothetical protein COT47_04755, partial [Candidatus Woesearchaeota archaeon CG08_land_8_20_14_0_20_43_7]
YQQTSEWQGLYGSLEVQMTLEDASGNVFYNWTSFNVNNGEVYFSRYGDVDFANILDPLASFVPYVQNVYGVANTTGADNLTSTFVDGVHTNFEINGTSITSPTPRVLTYNYTNSPIFETVLLREGGVNRDVYAAIIHENTVGFDGTTVDYQALLPIQTSTGFAQYYVYAELS